MENVANMLHALMVGLGIRLLKANNVLIWCRRMVLTLVYSLNKVYGLKGNLLAQAVTGLSIGLRLSDGDTEGGLGLAMWRKGRR